MDGVVQGYVNSIANATELRAKPYVCNVNICGLIQKLQKAIAYHWNNLA